MNKASLKNPRFDMQGTVIQFNHFKQPLKKQAPQDMKILTGILTLFSRGFGNSILRKTHFAISWPIVFKFRTLTLPGLKTLKLKPW